LCTSGNIVADVCLSVTRYISKLESAQTQYISQINDLKEVSVF